VERRLRKNQRTIRPAITAAMANTRPTISPVLGFQSWDWELLVSVEAVLNAVAGGFPVVEVGFVEINVNVGTGLGETIVLLLDTVINVVFSLEGAADVWDGVEAEGVVCAGVVCADVERGAVFGAATATTGCPAEEQ
jgi:hypothetical protein